MSGNTGNTASLSEILNELEVTPEAKAIVEQIMRDDVFHSTLDWQSASELRAGATKALRLFPADKDFYLASDRHSRAQFQLETAKLDESNGPKLEHAVEEERSAREELNKLLTYTLPANN